MAKVELRNVSKSFAGVTALDRINLTISAGEFLTLLGPSGSGKTTLLNILSGMISASDGVVLIDGRDVTDVPPRQRGLGMVFQNYALMPHMTVFDNVAFPLRIRKLSRSEIDRRVMESLGTVHLEKFAHRKPKELSGGQQQRVSIARCLVYKPGLILMDEPLGALDKKLREQLQLEIKRIHQEHGVTILYVTHDQEEALVLSNRICVMNNARIEQLGSPSELYFRPRTEFVADFLGGSNLIPAKVVDVTGDIATAQTEDGSRVRATVQPERPHHSIKLLVRPESVRLQRRNGQSGYGLSGIVQERIFVGQSTKYFISSGSLKLAAQVSSNSYGESFAPGDQVWAEWSEADSVLVDATACN
jgi:putative spermidine/putrescine transport system ATP-binding protein